MQYFDTKYFNNTQKTHPPESLFYDINEDLSFFLAYAMNKNEEKISIISHQTRIFFLMQRHLLNLLQHGFIDQKET